MNIVDTSGWLESFTDGNNAVLFYEPITRFEKLVVPIITIDELIKVIQRENDKHKFPMSGGIIFATSKQYSATVWTVVLLFRDLPVLTIFRSVPCNLTNHSSHKSARTLSQRNDNPHLVPSLSLLQTAYLR